jgi:hypothetical protein
MPSITHRCGLAASPVGGSLGCRLRRPRAARCPQLQLLWSCAIHMPKFRQSSPLLCLSTSCAPKPPLPPPLPPSSAPCCSAPFTRRWTTRMCGPTTSASTLRWRSPSLCPPSRRRPPSRHGSGWLPRRYACPRPAAAAADRACLPGLLPAALQILPSLSLIMHPVLAGGQVEVHRGQAGHR